MSDRQKTELGKYRVTTDRLLWCHNYRQPIRSRSEGRTIIEGQLPQAHFTMWHTCYKHVACNGVLGYTIISLCLCVYKILYKVCSRPNSDSVPLRWKQRPRQVATTKQWLTTYLVHCTIPAQTTPWLKSLATLTSSTPTSIVELLMVWRQHFWEEVDRRAVRNILVLYHTAYQSHLWKDCFSTCYHCNMRTNW